MELTVKNPNIDNVDEVFHAYIIQHNKHNITFSNVTLK